MEVYVLRGARPHDLLMPRRRHHCNSLLRSKVGISLVSPPCNTHSRARHANTDGPRPVRDKTWPGGRPGLTDKEQFAAQQANVLADYSLEDMGKAADASAIAWMEFPEDFGKAALGTLGPN